MKVTLQENDQFGEEGPQRSETALVAEIRKVDGDIQVLCLFFDHPGQFFWVPLKFLLIPHTENTETYWSTR